MGEGALRYSYQPTGLAGGAKALHFLVTIMQLKEKTQEEWQGGLEAVLPLDSARHTANKASSAAKSS